MQVCLRFADFFGISPAERQDTLLKAILDSHAFHFPRNRSYRRSVEAKGIGPSITENDLALVLRPTSQVFKSYIDALGMPFPNHNPLGFLQWLADNLSTDLPTDRFRLFRRKYRTLEALLQDIERIYADSGFAIGTSSGTSGKATIMMRDKEGTDLAAEAYQLAVYRLWGTRDNNQFIFVMPQKTRIVMASIALWATERLGLSDRVHFAIPFPATPDHVRIRSGRIFQPGMQGLIEQRLFYPFMNWMTDYYVKSTYVKRTIALLEQMAEEKKDVLLFGGWVQLHAIYQGLWERGYGNRGRVLTLSNDSMIGTGGGLKELYPFPAARIKADLETVLRTYEGEPVIHRDVYGMAEANWAAAQCVQGNYHLPPWIYAVVLDGNDDIIDSPDAPGILAFYDPFGGGKLFPNFFKTADRVRLINGTNCYDANRVCPCGYDSTYIVRESIQRQDRLDEAGCAGQL